MAHTDGPFYEPKVAILSLGGPVVFNFKPRPVLEQVGDSLQVSVRERERERGLGMLMRIVLERCL